VLGMSQYAAGSWGPLSGQRRWGLRRSPCRASPGSLIGRGSAYVSTGALAASPAEDGADTLASALQVPPASRVQAISPSARSQSMVSDYPRAGRDGQAPVTPRISAHRSHASDAGMDERAVGTRC
jgi:hypothetical protein